MVRESFSSRAAKETEAYGSSNREATSTISSAISIHVDVIMQPLPTLMALQQIQ